MAKELHIVALDYAPGLSNGIQSDAWFCIRSLSEKGVRISLHTSLEGAAFMSQTSAEHMNLLTYTDAEEPLRIKKNDTPVLFFGGIAYGHHKQQLEAPNRFIGIREFRDEAIFHRQLADLHSLGWRKISLTGKSSELSKIQQEIFASGISVFSTNAEAAIHLPAFVGNPIVQYTPGKGTFCIFTGNLAEKDTEFAAYWLLEHVFNTLDIPFVIVGDHPSLELENAAHVRANTCLVANPSLTELQELIKKSQVILTPSFLEPGSGFDFSHLLSFGRHLLGNKKSSDNPLLRSVLNIADTPEAFIEMTQTLFDCELTEQEKQQRQSVIQNLCSDDAVADTLIKHVWSHCQ
ncbi:MAG: hypothetical protein ACKO03_09765 [Bacteroidota bacterium]